MSEELELLEQRVGKHRKKLDQAASVVAMTRDRLGAAQSADKVSQREFTAAEAALSAAKKKVKELKQRAATAQDLADATARERTDTEQELTRDVDDHARRQHKLAKAESALAAARTSLRVETQASTPAKPRKRTKRTKRPTPATAARKQPTAKSATKATPRKATTKATPRKATTT